MFFQPFRNSLKIIVNGQKKNNAQQVLNLARSLSTATAARVQANRYNDVYNRSMEDPNSFWLEQSELIDWFEKPDFAIDMNTDLRFPHWFPNGKMNTSFNCLDRHVNNGLGNQTAIVYESVMTNTVIKKSYSELLKDVELAAGAMAKMGVNKGDRVLIYMPNSIEAVVSKLACARIGAVHCVVFGGFGAHELSLRIDHALPKLILAGSCGIEPKHTIEYQPLINKALELSSHKVKTVVYKQREQGPAVLKLGRDIDWDDFLANSFPMGPVELRSSDPLYILYSSGTTGAPKGVLRDNGGHAVALTWSMDNVYDMKKGETFWAASDVGWVVGHSYITYAPLLYGGTTVIFEGKPNIPDPGIFWKIIQDHQVKSMITAPTALRAISREDPKGEYVKKYDISCMEGVFPAGEHLDPQTEHFYNDILKIPVLDHYWQTESGWPIIAHCKGLGDGEIRYGAAGKPVPGWKVETLSSKGEVKKAEEKGELAFKLPLPPGALLGLHVGRERFLDTYMNSYPGWYKTGDAGYKDKDNYVFVMSRTDDVINVAGHRLSTGGIEEVLVAHPDVSEAAVFGVKDKLKGQLPFAFVVPNAMALESKTEEQIIKECIALVRERIGAVAALKYVRVIGRLPKTRSGKILRGPMKSMASGEEYKYPATIEDPETLYMVHKVFVDFGFNPSPVPKMM